MSNLNKLLLMGHVSQTPELRTVGQKQTPVTELSVAVNRYVPGPNGAKGEETADFFRVTVWGKDAERAVQYLDKGSAVFIEGRLQTDHWDDKETGKKRSALKVVSERWQFAGSPKGGSGAGRRPTSPAGSHASAGVDDQGDPVDVPFRSSIYKDVRTSRLNRRVI